MPDPTRPVAGAPIDTDWGQQVHDRIFQPPGCMVGDSVGQNVGSTYEQLNFDTTLDDPGGWVSGDTLIVPTGRDGLYECITLAGTENGSDGSSTRVQVRVNGSAAVTWIVQHDDSGAAQTGGGTAVFELAAGDEIEWWTKKTGGSNPNVRLHRGILIMVGTSIGA